MDFAFIIPFLTITSLLSTFSYDNYNKWDIYAATIPNGKLHSVQAKYLLTIILTILTTLFIAILSIIIMYFQNKVIEFNYLFILSSSLIISTLVCLGFMYPIIYKFGIDKARIGTFIAVFSIILLLNIIIPFMNIEKIVNNYINIYCLSIIVVIVISILIFISYKISVKINMNKEY